MMDPALLQLALASTAFVGTHFLLSHPLRAPLVKRLGEKGFLPVYSVVALATMVWMAESFKSAPATGLPGSGAAGWIIASILTLLAMVLLIGSLWRNPALPNPGAAPKVPGKAHGVFNVTRHPMMWGIALWAISHIVLWWSWRTVIVALAMLVLALVGSAFQDAKKHGLHGEVWAGWEAKTSYWPRLGGFAKVGWLVWLVAIAGWLAATWAHGPVGGVLAGVWLWV